MISKTMKSELVEMIYAKSFKYSPEPIFKLVSGKMSNFYVNCKPTTLSARGMYLTGNVIFSTIKELSVSAIGGLTFGADPISIATAFVSELEGRPLQAFSIRKDRKDHGIIKWVEGDIEPGSRVVFVDDAATTGGSTIKAIERARLSDLAVVGAVILIDRQEGGLENIQKHVPDVKAVITKLELMDYHQSLKQPAS